MKKITKQTELTNQQLMRVKGGSGIFKVFQEMKAMENLKELLIDLNS